MPNLPSVPSGITSGFTVDYTTAAANTFNYDGFNNWTRVQAVMNLGYNIFDMPSITRINVKILREALRRGKITQQRFYRPNQSPFIT